MPESGAVRCAAPVVLGGVLQSLPPATRYILRGSQAVRAAAASAFGVTIPAAACRAASDGTRAALWLGPDEWLLLAPESEGGALTTALDGALKNLPHSLVDVSHRQVGCTAAGAQAAALINCGCPLDLHPRAFPVDMCKRTVLGKAEVILWRTAADAFRIEVGRSFAAYVSAFLAEAARGLPAVGVATRR